MPRVNTNERKKTEPPINQAFRMVNRSTDFIKIFAGLGKEFIAELEGSYLRATAHLDKDSIPSYRSSLVHFLVFLDELRKVHGHEKFLARLKNDHGSLTRHQWNAVLGYYRAELAENGEITWRTKNNKINWLNPLLVQFGIDGVIPSVCRIDIFRHVPDSRPKRSLAEAHAGRVDDDELERLIQRTAKTSSEEMSKEIIGDFLYVLHQEFGNSDDLSTESILRVLDTRLENLRTAAESMLLKEYDIWKQGQSLIKECSMSGEEIHDVILYRSKNSRRQRAHNEKYLPSSLIGIGRLLKYCHSYHGGITPRYGLIENNIAIGVIVNRVANRVCGGVSNLWPYMHASSNLLAAVQTIILIDLAINAEAARELRRDCIHDVELDGYKEVRWWKGRAFGNEKTFLVPKKDKDKTVSTLRALEIALETTEVLAANSSEFSGYIFLNYIANTHYKNHNDRVCLMSGSAMLSRFKRFAEASGAKTAYTRDMIRPSVLLKKALETQNPFEVAELGQHGIDVSSRYIKKFPLELLHDRKIRQFINAMQVVAGDRIERFPEKVGVNSEYHEKIKSRIKNTGLGTLCAAEKERVGDSEAEPCAQIEKCLDCKFSEKKVIAEPKNICDIIHFNRYLTAQRSNMEVDSPKRWAEVWLPWLLYTEVALEKLRERQFRYVFNEGLKLAEATSPEFPPLW